jgi:hypothetical protein
MNSLPLSKPEYLEQVLNLYTGLAETPARYSRIDRRLAEDLYHKQIALEDVETAMYLAIARRLMRDENAPPLGPIRSLHYFLPLIEEVRSTPLSPEYRKYLRGKVAAFRNKNKTQDRY